MFYLTASYWLLQPLLRERLRAGSAETSLPGALPAESPACREPCLRPPGGSGWGQGVELPRTADKTARRGIGVLGVRGVLSCPPFGRGTRGGGAAGRGRFRQVKVGMGSSPTLEVAPAQSHPTAWGTTSLLPLPQACHSPTHQTSPRTAGPGQALAGGCGQARLWDSEHPQPLTPGRALPSIPRRGCGPVPSGGREAGGGSALPGPSDSRCLPQLPIQIKLIKPPIQH